MTGKSKGAATAASRQRLTAQKWMTALPRKQVRPDELVPLELSDRERQMILEHTFADKELTWRLYVKPAPNEPPVYHLTLDDWEDLAGYVAAEANHTEDRKVQRAWDKLYSRIADMLDSYTVEGE